MCFRNSQSSPNSQYPKAASRLQGNYAPKNVSNLNQAIPQTLANGASRLPSNSQRVYGGVFEGATRSPSNKNLPGMHIQEKMYNRSQNSAHGTINPDRTPASAVFHNQHNINSPQGSILPQSSTNQLAAFNGNQATLTLRSDMRGGHTNITHMPSDQGMFSEVNAKLLDAVRKGTFLNKNEWTVLAFHPPLFFGIFHKQPQNQLKTSRRLSSIQRRHLQAQFFVKVLQSIPTVNLFKVKRHPLEQAARSKDAVRGQETKASYLWRFKGGKLISDNMPSINIGEPVTEIELTGLISGQRNSTEVKVSMEAKREVHTSCQQSYHKVSASMSLSPNDQSCKSLTGRHVISAADHKKVCGAAASGQRCYCILEPKSCPQSACAQKSNDPIQGIQQMINRTNSPVREHNSLAKQTQSPNIKIQTGSSVSNTYSAQVYQQSNSVRISLNAQANQQFNAIASVSPIGPTSQQSNASFYASSNARVSQEDQQSNITRNAQATQQSNANLHVSSAAQTSQQSNASFYASSNARVPQEEQQSNATINITRNAQDTQQSNVNLHVSSAAQTRQQSNASFYASSNARVSQEDQQSNITRNAQATQQSNVNLHVSSAAQTSQQSNSSFYASSNARVSQGDQQSNITRNAQATQQSNVNLHVSSAAQTTQQSNASFYASSSARVSQGDEQSNATINNTRNAQETQQSNANLQVSATAQASQQSNTIFYVSRNPRANQQCNTNANAQANQQSSTSLQVSSTGQTSQSKNSFHVSRNAQDNQQYNSSLDASRNAQTHQRSNAVLHVSRNAKESQHSNANFHVLPNSQTHHHANPSFPPVPRNAQNTQQCISNLNVSYNAQTHQQSNAALPASGNAKESHVSSKPQTNQRVQVIQQRTASLDISPSAQVKQQSNTTLKTSCNAQANQQPNASLDNSRNAQPSQQSNKARINNSQTSKIKVVPKIETNSSCQKESSKKTEASITIKSERTSDKQCSFLTSLPPKKQYTSLQQLAKKIIETRQRFEMENIPWKKKILKSLEGVLMKRLRKIERETGEEAELDDMKSSETEANTTELENKK
ncbi:hypothetical protein OS493_022894 [Desmophyllum pertusum]|uniref:Uncharacterized protein n=1 Tax=Desmophyllum pertusum TaxID=174260 RepID=A0A9W9ZM78_9CNID|nr:hypothetical protein OS493_022894 [Desmophyllum pertusum]